MHRKIFRRTEGAAMVETVLTLPIVFLLILCLFKLGYFTFVKLSLQLTVHYTLNRLAGDGLISQAVGSFQGPDRTFGLDPERLKFVVIPIPIPEERPRVLGLACYESGMYMPSFGLNPADAMRPHVPQHAGRFKDAHQALEEADQARREASRKVDELREQVQDLAFTLSIVRGLNSGDEAVRERSLQFLLGYAMEQGLTSVCSSENGTVIRAKAVMISEPIRHAP